MTDEAIAEAFMRCVANFEITSDVSVVTDDLVLTIKDPRGSYEARIKNIPRSEYTTPFLLSLHLNFDAPGLKEANDVADDLLANCLNMLAFTTGSSFRKHRIRQIVDAEPKQGAMRDVLMWGEVVEYDDPQPFLRPEHTSSIERLLQFDVPPAIRRALRWYRLGIHADSPDDQFTYFWFALEIVAEFQKPTSKVHDKCPHCQSALYCEKCEKHPEHRPYAKQSIRALMMAADGECDEATAALLDQTRNSLMHGATLREIESTLPDPHESVVDILGRILLKALVRQFPKEVVEGAYMAFLRLICITESMRLPICRRLSLWIRRDILIWSLKGFR
ncbi:methylamine utilization protein MauJ [Rhizobium laguerreae]|nr:methylamine utilization protein MauJ [Rhizobium laguerreae]